MELIRKVVNDFSDDLVMNSLVKARSVRVLVFLNDRDNQGDQFGPEIKVLYAWTLFFRRNFTFL